MSLSCPTRGCCCLSLLEEQNKRSPPQSWADLLKPEFKGKIAMAFPFSSGTAYTVLATLLPVLRLNQEFSVGSRVEVVRPEGIELTAPGEGDLQGIIQFIQYPGARALYEIVLPGGERLHAEMPNPQERGWHREGEAVGLVLHRHSLHLLPAG